MGEKQMSYDFGLNGKIALVTGASSGLGLRGARVLAEQGAHVVLAARRGEVIEEIAGEIRQAGGEATPVVLDMTSLDSIRHGVDQIIGSVGAIDILVNNAGVSRQVELDAVDEDYYDWIFNTNVKGPFFLAQKVIRQMIEKGIPGRIVNIASTAAYGALPNLAVYGMSKAAIVQMTKALALEVADHDINVNCIAPGYIPTAISPQFPETPAGKQMISTLPRHRPGSPEDMDAALLTLCSASASRLITGALLSVDDGYSVI